MTEGAELRKLVSKRFDIVSSLRGGAKSKPELVAELDSSRSTIDRAVTELMENGCVEPVAVGEREYCLTVTGRLLQQSYAEFYGKSAVVGEGKPLLNALPEDAPLGTEFLSGAKVHNHPKTPDVATEPVHETFPEAEKMVGTAPVVHQPYYELVFEGLVQRGAPVEIVLESELLQSVRQHHRDEFDTFVDSDLVTIHVYDGEIPYALWYFEPAVAAGIKIYENGGSLGTILNDTDEGIRWARQQCRQYIEHSTELDAWIEKSPPEAE